MRSFQILDSRTNIFQNHLLEASAGTGKTFSIENLCVRLLLEICPHLGRSLTINEILVVTFTKAATKELKQRIYKKIQACKDILSKALDEESAVFSEMDYMQSILSKGKKEIVKALEALQNALVSFNQAQIYTIHSFCLNSLQKYRNIAKVDSSKSQAPEAIGHKDLQKVIRNFFLSALVPEKYSIAQLSILLKGDPQQKKLMHSLQKKGHYPGLPQFADLFKEFQRSLSELKDEFGLTSSILIAEFKQLQKWFKNGPHGLTKEETLRRIEAFSCLFDKNDWTYEDFDALIEDETLIWTASLDPSLIKKNAQLPPSLIKNGWESFNKSLKIKLEPIIERAAHFNYLFVRFCDDCQNHLRSYQEKHCKFFPDDYLFIMQSFLKESPAFLRDVQNQYFAAIIDEFQDTDPVQWDIFERLFLSDENRWNGYLYLVGDPKQSIYLFRQADIYTYLRAANRLGDDARFLLDTNFRSQKNLVKALNRLFASDHMNHLIPLPKFNSTLEYHPVKAAKTDSERVADAPLRFFVAHLTDQKKRLETAEKDFFFPFILNEIRSLKTTFSLNDFAVLVRDHAQADRFNDYLKAGGIPAKLQKNKSLIVSEAYYSFVYFLNAVLHPSNKSFIHAALGTKFFGWFHHQLVDSHHLEIAYDFFERLNEKIREVPFYTFFRQFFHQPLLENEMSPFQRLQASGEHDFIFQLDQLIELITDHQTTDWKTIDRLLSFLDELKEWEEADDPRVKQMTQEKDAVTLITIHASKGLEFTVVFALGLVNRTEHSHEMILLEKGEKRVIEPFLQGSVEAEKYLEEIDAEKMRQLYVALTRAKELLYIPIIACEETKILSSGEASPIELFLARAKGLMSQEEIYKEINNPSIDRLKDYLESISYEKCISYSICECDGQKS